MTLLLTILTALLGAILLIALVVALFIILRTLQSVRRSLEKINYGVRAIETETGMLGGVETLNGGLVGVRDGLKLVDENLFETNESLNTVAAHLGIGSAAQK